MLQQLKPALESTFIALQAVVVLFSYFMTGCPSAV
jgi:hypothetical protein